MAITATVSSKGQITLPIEMRKLLGIEPGSTITFETEGKAIIIKPELPVSAYYGILKGYNITDTEIPKEKDRLDE